MNRKLNLLFFAVVLLTHTGYSQPGTLKQTGNTGAWANTILAASANGILYSIETSGALYKTNLATGKYEQIGKQSYANTDFLFVSSNNILFTIEKDGNLYRTNPETAVVVQIGNAGDWANTITGTMIGNSLYTAESSGFLYNTNGNTGRWQQVGKADFANTVFLFGDNSWLNDGIHWLYSIEEDGSYCEISTKDGGCDDLFMTAGNFENTIAGTVLNGKLYTIKSNGTLIETEVVKGLGQQIGNADFANTKFMFTGKDKLYIIENKGTMYEISVK